MLDTPSVYKPLKQTKLIHRAYQKGHRTKLGKVKRNINGSHHQHHQHFSSNTHKHFFRFLLFQNGINLVKSSNIKNNSSCCCLIMIRPIARHRKTLKSYYMKKEKIFPKSKETIFTRIIYKDLNDIKLCFFFENSDWGDLFSCQKQFLHASR